MPTDGVAIPRIDEIPGPISKLLVYYPIIRGIATPSVGAPLFDSSPHAGLGISSVGPTPRTLRERWLACADKFLPAMYRLESGWSRRRTEIGWPPAWRRPHSQKVPSGCGMRRRLERSGAARACVGGW